MKIKGIIIILLMAGSLHILSAQNFNDVLRLSVPNIYSSAYTTGMGNSGIASGGNYAASLLNPAGLALIKRAELSGGLDYSGFNSTNSLFGNSTKSFSSSTSFNQFGFTVPIPTVRGSLVFSLGYDRVRDFNASYKFEGFNSGNHSQIQDLTSVNDDIAYQLGLSFGVFDDAGNYLHDSTLVKGNLLQYGDILKSGSVDSWNFSGALEVAQNVFFGASLNIFSGTYKSERYYSEYDSKNVYPLGSLMDPSDDRTSGFNSFSISDIVSWDLSGWDLKAGLLYKLNRHLNVGATIKFPSLFTIKEDYFVDANSLFDNDNEFNLDQPYNSVIEYSVTTPFEFSGGLEAKLFGFRFTGDINFIDYTQMKFDDGLDLGIISENNKTIKDIFKSTLNYSYGLEYTVPFFNIALRSGMIYQESPFKDDPAEFNRVYYTTGIGINPGSDLEFNVAYIHGSWKDFSDNYDSNLSRVYNDITKNSINLSVTYRY